MEVIFDPPRMYEFALVLLLGAGVSAFVLLFFLSAPYGRHARAGWGPVAGPRMAWVAMELPSLAAFVVAVWSWSTAPPRATAAVLIMFWVLHYGYRGLVYPFRIRPSGQGVPWLVVGLAVLFNITNGTTNGYALGALSSGVGPAPEVFALGCGLWVGGVLINQHADHVLRSLRGPGETGYRVPVGGLYRWVSCPNYLGEIVEWLGFALAASTGAAWVFFFFTCCNLLPRALTHHRWYRSEFPDYPTSRRALIPWVL